MNELSPRQHADGKRAVILSSLYTQATGKQRVRSTIEPLLLQAPHARRTVVATENLRHSNAAVTKKHEEENDPLATIPSWIKFVGVSVIVMLVVVLFGSTTLRPAQPRAGPKKIVASSIRVATAPLRIIKPVVRLAAADPNQYASNDEYNTWWGSVCSTASMASVFNAYGHNYKITDVLKIEAGLKNPQEITSDLGLLTNSAIDRTASAFGFKTVWLNDSLDGIIKRANQGNPIIVNFPPNLWKGGHFLVVTGGNATQVYLIDSSKINMHVMARQKFLSYWVGLAALVTPKVQVLAPSGTYSVIGGPTLSAEYMNRILSAYHSPAAGNAQALYNLGVKYGIDPAFALGFFFHESSFGTAGEARTTLALGNLRCIASRPCVNTNGSACQNDQSCYAQFSSWEDGFEGWYIQIRAYIDGSINQVVGRNVCPCTTVPQIIPVYAPPTDGNDDRVYIKTVETAIDTWHAGKIWVPNVE